MTSQVYCGTYSKYNSGSIAGAWIDLEKFSDHDEFMVACRELHKDEEDPEFMFQDFEGFPKSYYSESGIAPEVFEWLALEDHQREILEAYIAIMGDDSATIEDAEDCYFGHFENDEDFAQEYIDSTGMLHEVPENLRYYFDVEKFARDLMFDFSEHGGHYFSNN